MLRGVGWAPRLARTPPRLVYSTVTDEPDGYSSYEAIYLGALKGLPSLLAPGGGYQVLPPWPAILKPKPCRAVSTPVGWNRLPHRGNGVCAAPSRASDRFQKPAGIPFGPEYRDSVTAVPLL